MQEQERKRGAGIVPSSCYQSCFPFPARFQLWPPTLLSLYPLSHPTTFPVC